jgi:hypothetical protein
MFTRKIKMAIGIKNLIKKQPKEQPRKKAAWIRIRANSWIVRLTIAAGVTQIITNPVVNHQVEAGVGLVGVEGDSFFSHKGAKSPREYNNVIPAEAGIHGDHNRRHLQK